MTTRKEKLKKKESEIALKWQRADEARETCPTGGSCASCMFYKWRDYNLGDFVDAYCTATRRG